MSRNRGISPVPDGLGETLTDFLQQLRRSVNDVMAGRLGGGNSSSSGSSSGGTVVIGGGGGSGGTYEPDLTPPPTPSGVNVVAGIASVVIRTDSPTFTAGHGHLATLVYGKKYGGTGPLPTFSDDSKQFEFSGEIGGFATDPATQWHFWLTWKSKDGVESVAPAGGMNGFQVTTGQDVALLLKSLTGQIRASELAAALGNRIDLIDGAAPGSVNARILVESTARSDLDQSIQALHTVRAVASGGGRTVVGGFGLAATSTAVQGPRIDFGVSANTFFVDAPAGSGVTSSMVPFVVRTTVSDENGVAVPAGVYMDSAYMVNLTAMYARIKSLVADDITTSNLFAVTATIGNLKGTYEIRSTNYTSGSSGTGYRLTPTLIELPATAIRGKITAEQFDGRGAVLRDNDGNPIFSVNDPLAAERIIPAAGWLNSALVPNINSARGANLFTGSLAVASSTYLGGAVSATGQVDPQGSTNAVTISIPAAGSYVHYRAFSGLQTGYYTVKLRLYVGGGDQIVVSSTDATSWAGGSYTIATRSGAPGWVQVSLRQYTGTGNLDVVVGSFLGTSSVFSSPLPIAVNVSDLWVEREGYAGDLNATFGAAWGSSLSGVPSNLAGLSGAEAIRNGDVTITLNSDGTASVSGGPSAYGGVTAAGLGAVKTDLSNAPSGILNSNITLSGLGARAMALIDYITAAAASTYIQAAAITLAHINTASIGTLSALSSFLGAVEIAVGGYLRSGQTAWSTGSGFWLGWVGSGPGEPGLSIGSSSAYLRYKPSTGLELKLDGMSASISTAGIYSNVSNGGPRDYGYCTASVSGGTGPYSYSWSLIEATYDNGFVSEAPASVYMTSSGTNQAYFRGVSSNAYVTVYAECLITDSNGRSVRAPAVFQVLHGTYTPS